MLVKDKLFIGGQWVAPSSAETIDVHNAGNGEVMGRVPAATEKDADAAVPAARGPREAAPCNAFLRAEVIEQAALPKGVFNLVTVYGPKVGEALVKHPDVDMISFTGSTRAGKRISGLAAQGVKRVALELGGKSASVIL